MNYEERLEIINRLQTQRQSHLISLVTSLRPNATGQIADDQVRELYEHLSRLPERPIERLDLFLCSMGGSGTTPWRIVSLLREYTREFNVLIPFKAYSAATLIALGADEIVMHPCGELGPIDPTVSNDYNPVENNTGRKLGISVEDVKAYVNFVKCTVGITHEDELVKTFEILANKVHPLALGNVERFLAQSRMVARKILRTHMREADEHIIDEIIENMASKLFFHGHPINRNEAKNDLKLKINTELPAEIETDMWRLYESYENEMLHRQPFNPAGDLLAKARLLQQGQPPQDLVQEYDLIYACIESSRLACAYKATKRFTQSNVQGPQGLQDIIQEHTLELGWRRSPV